MANAESYFVCTVANAVSLTPVIVGQSTGGYLSVPGIAIIQGDNTCHEDSSRPMKLNLISVVARIFRYIVRLTVAGDMNDGNFEGHNICKIVEIEHASIPCCEYTEAILVVACACLLLWDCNTELIVKEEESKVQYCPLFIPP